MGTFMSLRFWQDDLYYGQGPFGSELRTHKLATATAVCHRCCQGAEHIQESQVVSELVQKAHAPQNMAPQALQNLQYPPIGMNKRATFWYAHLQRGVCPEQRAGPSITNAVVQSYV